MYKIIAKRFDFPNMTPYFKGFVKFEDRWQNENLIVITHLNEAFAKVYNDIEEAKKDKVIIETFGYKCELVG